MLDVGLAALGAAVLLGIIWTHYGAVTDRAIVVNSFVVSPKLQAAGASGATVAGQFLDEMIRLRESARADIATEYVSEHSDPVQMAYYLHRAHRPEEAIGLIRGRFASAPREQQAILLNIWGNVLATSDQLP